MAANPIFIGPSILSADFRRLGEQVAAAEAAGADFIHVDVMDGVFVPNISIGFPILEAVNASTRLPIDVHLMIVEPSRWIERFAAAGADTITVHAEVDPNLGQGMGLGLTVSRSLMDEYGGAIQFVPPTDGFATAVELRWPRR